MNKKKSPEITCPFCKIKGWIIKNGDKWSVEFGSTLDYPKSHHPECALRYVRSYPVYTSIEKLLLSWNPACYPDPPEIKKPKELTKEQIAEDKKKMKHAYKMLDKLVIPKRKAS